MQNGRLYVRTVVLTVVQLLIAFLTDVPIESEHIVVEELKSMTNWYTLGIHLGMKSSTLNRIEDHYSRPHGPARCLYQLIVKWWNLNPHATWRDVVAALRKSEEIRLANSIEDKYKLPSCQCKLVLSPSAQQAESNITFMSLLLQYKRLMYFPLRTSDDYEALQ